MARPRTLRTLFLTQTYPRYPNDTAGPFIREIARGMVRAGDQVRVLVPHAEGVRDRWDDEGVEVESFRYAPQVLERVGYSRSLRRDERLQIGSAAAAPLYLLGARRALRRSLRAQPWDVVQAHWVVPNGPPMTSLMPQPVEGRKPVVGFGLHGSDVFLAEKPLVRALVRRSLARADFLTGCSPELVERIERLGTLGGPHATSRVIPYGIDVAGFAPGEDTTGWRARLGMDQEAVVLLGVGRMATKKGFQVLVRIAPDLLRSHPQLHIVLAGGGDREGEFRSALAAHEGRVHFPGLVERDELPDLFRAADLFCLPAVHDEKGNVDGLPNVLLEAMATGLPVVSTEVSGIPLAVVHGATGFLVPEADAGELQKAIEQLLASPETAATMGQAGLQRVRQDFTWDQTAAKYRETYFEALGQRPGAGQGPTAKVKR